MGVQLKNYKDKQNILTKILINCAYRMTLKGFNGFVDTEFADMYTLICTARGEARVGLPVYVQRRGRVKGELLCALTTRSIPYNCCLKPICD